MPVVYDEWFTTPAHGVFAFYSNRKCLLKCPNQISRIQAAAGTIEIPRGCSGKNIIRAPIDETATRKTFFKVDFQKDSLQLD